MDEMSSIFLKKKKKKKIVDSRYLYFAYIE